MSDLISIIIPVYNAEQFLDDTLRCIFAQDYENWELLLVDDCSKDGSIEKIENIMQAYPQYRDRVRLIRQNTNKASIWLEAGLLHSKMQMIYGIQRNYRKCTRSCRR